MIKKIIFDVDNTLIKWDKKYWYSLNKTLEYFNIKYNDETVNKLIKAVDDYEIRYDTYKIEYMINMMEEYTNINLPDNFVDIWLSFLEECVPKKEDNNLIKTLEYLQEKYELVILTNWFKSSQVARLKKVGIYKYFKQIYSADFFPMKPKYESFLTAIGDLSPNECVMVGDNLDVDIKNPYEMGMNVYYLTNNESSYPSIKSIEELKEIL